jgi:putative DNA primase/helicase
MADGLGPDDADENVINLADRLKKEKEKNKNRARKPRHKREMPEDDERSQSGCEMRDGGAHPGLYLISGLGVQLSQHFKVLATCDAYEADGIARRRGVLIGFKNSNGRDVELFLSNEILFGDRTKLAKALSEARFSFVSADKPLGFLRCYLSDYECSLRAIVVRRAGWIEHRDKLIGFMLPSGMIPENPVGETPYILDPVASTARYVSRGTIEDFKQGAARLAELHTLGRFRMASAFVGPLKFTDQEGGGWHLWGPSSDIKSILDLLAMMVWGRAGRGGGFGRKWYGTANGIEGVAAAHNDTALFLDDTSNAEAKDIVKIIYMLVGEEQKSRMRADRSMDETPPIRTNLLSNGERDIAEILKRAKLEVPGGVIVRVPGIAAIGRGRSAGEPGASLDVSSTHWRAFIKEAAHVLRGPGYGVAGPLFIRILIERKIGGERVGNLIDGFVKRVGADEMHPQVVRVAMKAGLVAAAGEMAIEFGVLSWPVGSAIDAAEYVFQEWLKRRGTTGSHELMEALRKIQALFEQSGTSRFDPLHTVTQADFTDPLPGEPPPAGPIDPNDPPLTTHSGGRAPASRRLGWVSGLGEKQRWYIAEQTWKDEVGKLYDVRAINSVLEKKGALEFEVQTNREKPRNRLKRIMINGKRYPFIVVTPEIFQVASDPSEEA